jgi:osmotically-inducible protein OsmY
MRAQRFLAPAVLCLALVALPLACSREGQPPAVQTQKDAQGNEHIDINKQQIKRNIDQAGEELRKDASNLGKAVESGAQKLDEHLGPAARDAALIARVKTRLVRAPDLGGIHIGVDAKDGRVTLTGTVATVEKRADAERIATRTEGVRAVDNQIQVGPVG